MARSSLASMMNGTEPSGDPDPSFEVRPTTQTYYDYKNLTPQRLRDVFDMADNNGRVDLLYKLYDDMEVTDTRYSGIINQLRSTIARMPLRNIPAEGRTSRESDLAEEYKDYAEEVLTELDVHALAQEFAEPYVRGANLYRVEWEQEDLPYNRSMWFPRHVESVQGKHIIEDTQSTSDTFGELLVRTKNNPAGEPISELPDSNHIFLESRQGKHNYAQMGVARKITPWYLALRFTKTWYAQYIENYGQPLRIGKYPTGSKKSKRQKMKQFLRQLGSNGYGLFPSGMEVELIDLNRQGKVNVHKQFIDLAHREYSIALLGQAGTTGEGREGSYAQTSILNGIRMDIVEHVGKIVAKGFQKLVRKGLKLNYGDEFKNHLVPEIKPILLNAQNAQSRAKAMQTLHDIGHPVPSNYAYENILGTEKPSIGEEVLHNGEIKEIESSEFSKDLEPMDNSNNGSTTSNNSSDNSDQTVDRQGEDSVVNNPDEQ